MHGRGAETVLPPPVKRGDKVSIIAPSGPVDEKLLDAGCAILRLWGLEPVISDQVYSRQAYLAGPDHARAEAVLAAFNDPDTTAVICARGGYGTTRLLPSLPADKLGLHNAGKKRLYGFSDITALHILLQHSLPGYVSFHSPMPATDLFVAGTPPSHLSLRSALFEDSLPLACPPLKGRCLQMGRAGDSCGVVSGRLVGGNLSLVVSLLGTPWQAEVRGAVLLLEDVNEAAYRMDRMWTQLAATGLNGLAALVLGDFANAVGDGDPKEGVGDTFAGVSGPQWESWFWLKQMRLPPSLPILCGLPIGHIRDNRTMPIGANVEVDLIHEVIRVAE